jgi:hypothetical protein
MKVEYNTLKIKRNTTHKNKPLLKNMTVISNFINKQFVRKRTINEVMRFGV